MGYALDQVKSALRSNLKDIDLSGLDFGYKGGRARAEVGIDFGQKKFDLQGRIDGIDVARLHGDFSGRADLEISGRGEFLKDPLEISYRSAKLSISTATADSASTARPSVLTDFSDFRLTSGGEALISPAGASPFSLDISRQGSRYSGSFNFNLIDLNLLIPWKNNVGSMRLLGQIYSDERRRHQQPRRGHLFRPTLSLPNFSHSLDNFQGTVTFVDKNFSLQSLSGEMGGGKVEGNGQLVIDGGGLQQHDLQPPGQEPAPLSHGPHLLPGQPRPDPEIRAEKTAAVRDPGVPVGRTGRGRSTSASSSAPARNCRPPNPRSARCCSWTSPSTARTS